MGDMNIKLKALPSSVDENLNLIKEDSRKVIEGKGGKSVNFEEEAIAFGLKALVINFLCPESLELEPIENALREVKGISSIEMIDMRRAL